MYVVGFVRIKSVGSSDPLNCHLLLLFLLRALFRGLEELLLRPEATMMVHEKLHKMEQQCSNNSRVVSNHTSENEEKCERGNMKNVVAPKADESGTNDASAKIYAQKSLNHAG